MHGQSCLTLCNPVGYGPPGSSVHVGFSRQEHWSGLPFPSPGIFPTQGSNLCLRIGGQILDHCAVWEAPQSPGTGGILAGGGSSQCCHTDVFSSSNLVAQRLGGSRLQPIFFSFHLKGKRVNSLLENKARALSWISDSPCVYVWVLSCSVMSDSLWPFGL